MDFYNNMNKQISSKKNKKQKIINEKREMLLMNPEDPDLNQSTDGKRRANKKIARSFGCIR